MNEKLKEPSQQGAGLCDWCGIPLGSANLVRQSVCIRCYKLLLGCNLSDEEIFSGKHSIKEAHLSDKDTKNKR